MSESDTRGTSSLSVVPIHVPVYVAMRRERGVSDTTTIYRICPMLTDSSPIQPVSTVSEDDVGFGFNIHPSFSRPLLFGGKTMPQQILLAAAESFSPDHRPLTTMKAQRSDIFTLECGCATVALGHQIYIFGVYEGTPPPSTIPQPYWYKPSPPPPIVYSKSQVIPFPWAEVYNVTSDTCSPLPPPPQQMIREGSVSSIIVLEKTGQILLKSWHSGDFFCLDTKSNNWSRFETILDSYDMPLRNAVIDSSVYYYDQGYVRGFDLANNKWLSKFPVKGLKNLRGQFISEDCDNPASMFHLGDGILCVVWYAYKQICHMTFRVSNVFNTLQAKILTEGIHYCPEAIYVDSCLGPALSEEHFARTYSLAPWIVNLFGRLDHQISTEEYGVLNIRTRYGGLLRELAEHGVSNMTGIDTYKEVIDYAKSFAQYGGLESIRFLVGDIFTYDPNMQFQLIVDGGALDSINVLLDDASTKRLMYWDSVSRLLAPRGILVIIATNYDKAELVMEGSAMGFNYLSCVPDYIRGPKCSAVVFYRNGEWVAD